jgi:2,3-bisphosphoglycerate-independent phosphoglycerate mutase
MANVGGSSTGPGPKPDAAWVANEFVKRYYEVLAKHPKYLNRFYKEESQFTLVLRNHGGVETRTTVSTTQVRDRAFMCFGC